jgi:Tfp pilus assembly protein PilN
MMRQVDLLPVSYAESRRARRNLGIAVGGGMVALLLLVAWWFILGGQVSGAKSDLAEAQARNAELSSQIAELQRFADLEAEVQAKEVALKTVMAGDIAWPSIMTEVAMVLPGEVWLKEIIASAGLNEGSAPAGTETAAVRVSDKTPIGRIQFKGASLTMPGVAKLLIQLAGTKGFAAEWLDIAAKTQEAEGSASYFDFTSTIELTGKAASGRFLRGTP